MKAALWLCSLCLLALFPLKAQAQPGLRPVSKDEYRQNLARLDSLVLTCRTAPPSCDPTQIGDDQTVDAGRFEARFDWLRSSLAEAKDPHRTDRAALLTAASTRLQDEAADLDTPPPALGPTQSKATEILSRAEFRHAPADTFWQKQIAALYAFLDRLFAGTGRWLPRAAWFAPALEWSILALAAAGLLLWAWRVTRQERLRIIAHSAPAEPWLAESDDWAARAEAEAARAAWRDAVHSLYWSAIVMLEGQRLWSRNRARTPREYVALLPPDSEKRTRLSGLTALFERLWYGLRPASETDFQQAKALRDAMRAG